MGEENITNLSKAQKDKIYRDMLSPLKARISKVLLYDTQAALQFLQEYNKIIENEEQTLSSLLKSIVELEVKMNEYEKSEGRIKLFEEKSKAFLERIEDLRINSIQLSLEDFENQFAQLKASFEENVLNYGFKDRAIVERDFYALQANLIMRQVASGRTTDEWQQNITEQDKVGLHAFVNEQINTFRQQEDLNDIATKINNIAITDKEPALNPDLWSWMNAAEKGIKSQTQLQQAQPTASTAMIIAPINNKDKIQNWFSRLFSKEPLFPLQARDLGKIDVEWLSQYIPKSMLVELENRRLDKEGNRVENRYLPVPKAVIFEMLKKSRDTKSGVYKKRYELLKENGGKLYVTIMEDWGFGGWTRNNPCYNRVVMEAGGIIKEGRGAQLGMDGFYKEAKSLNDALTYANLLDRIFNTDFEQQLLQEIKDLYIDRIHKKCPIYDNLIKSFRTMQYEYEETKLDFEATEYLKRKQFYEKNKFKEQLIQTEPIVVEETQKINPQPKKVSVKVINGGQEQGGK